MKRFVLLVLPAFVVGAAVGAAVVVGYRRRSHRAVSPVRTITTRETATATPGVEVLAGYDERHEEELEARHGAVLHIDVEKLSVRQI